MTTKDDDEGDSEELPEPLFLWNVLKTCRENRGLSQRAAADLVGIPQSNLNRIESGRKALREDTLIRVAAGYGMTARDLLLEGLGMQAPPRRAHGPRKERPPSPGSDDEPYRPGSKR